MKKHQYQSLKLQNKAIKKELRQMKVVVNELNKRFWNLTDHNAMVAARLPMRGGELIENVKTILEILTTQTNAQIDPKNDPLPNGDCGAIL
jgi:hypothetical protein